MAGRPRAGPQAGPSTTAKTEADTDVSESRPAKRPRVEATEDDIKPNSNANDAEIDAAVEDASATEAADLLSSDNQKELRQSLSDLPCVADFCLIPFGASETSSVAEYITGMHFFVDVDVHLCSLSRAECHRVLQKSALKHTVRAQSCAKLTKVDFQLHGYGVSLFYLGSALTDLFII